MSSKYFSRNKSIDELILMINKNFPSEPVISRNTCLSYASGDAWSVENIISILNYRPWNEISADDLYRCGYSELRSYLTKEAFIYYLPAILKVVLQEINFEKSRLHEMAIQMLMPYKKGNEDVWDFFGDGLFDRPLDNYAKNLIDRSRFVYDNLNINQYACIFCYIEITESNKINYLDEELMILLYKYSNTWVLSCW